MANMRVTRRVERIATDLQKLVAHVQQHSGIGDSPRHVENEANAICELAARLVDEARKAQGAACGRSTVEHNVRKALGYVRP